jgi:hypothetical protein
MWCAQNCVLKQATQPILLRDMLRLSELEMGIFMSLAATASIVMARFHSNDLLQKLRGNLPEAIQQMLRYQVLQRFVMVRDRDVAFQVHVVLTANLFTVACASCLTLVATRWLPHSGCLTLVTPRWAVAATLHCSGAYTRDGRATIAASAGVAVLLLLLLLVPLLLLWIATVCCCCCCWLLLVVVVVVVVVVIVVVGVDTAGLCS